MPDIERPVTRREILKKGALGAVGLTVCHRSRSMLFSATPSPAPTPVPTPVTPGVTPVRQSSPTANYAGRTLTIWDYESADSAMGQSWAAAIDTFKSTHPGVTVTHEAKAFEDIQSNASMILNSNAAPTSWSTTKATRRRASCRTPPGIAHRPHKCRPARGWDTRSSLRACRHLHVQPQGIMGSGKWYGIA